MNEKKIYCVYCGSENKIDNQFCIQCKKELNPKENLLKDYLYEHTKDHLKGNIEDSIYTLIRKYLLSHLYGLILTISMIIVAGVTIYASEPYIKEIPSISFNDLQNDDYEDEITIIHERLMEYIDYATLGDDLQNQYKLPNSIGNYEVEITNTDGYASISYQIETNKPSFNPENPQTSVGQYYKDEGYSIAETSVYYEVEVDDTMILIQNEYYITLVKLDDVWYIAEAILK